MKPNKIFFITCLVTLSQSCVLSSNKVSSDSNSTIFSKLASLSFSVNGSTLEAGLYQIDASDLADGDGNLMITVPFYNPFDPTEYDLVTCSLHTTVEGDAMAGALTAHNIVPELSDSECEYFDVDPNAVVTYESTNNGYKLCSPNMRNACVPPDLQPFIDPVDANCLLFGFAK